MKTVMVLGALLAVMFVATAAADDSWRYNWVTTVHPEPAAIEAMYECETEDGVILADSFQDLLKEAGIAG